MNRLSPWQGAPRRTIAIFLAAVFFVFTTFGFANDIIALGQQNELRFGLSVLISGVFATMYAATGIMLRGKFWKAFLPLFAVQVVLMGWLGNVLPDAATPLAQDANLARLHSRLAFDGLSIIVAVCLGYIGFVFVSISEGKRYARTREEMTALENEMAAARQVQQVILPAPNESFPGFIVDSVYKPAQQVGGDFFQIIAGNKGGLLIVFGDVSGKGLPAAMLVAMLVGAIRATAEDTRDPVQLLRRLHERLLGRTSGGFATALAASIAEDGTVTIANAGHLSPYLDGEEVELPSALPLGIAGGGQYALATLKVRPGSRLTFVSDGVVEAMNQTGELFGFERSRAISTESADAIAETAVRFGQADDITVVTIEREGAVDPVQQLVSTRAGE
jgi:hypothetical protein